MATTDEILAGPWDVYIAPKGTARPDIDDPPSVTWLLLGTQGAKNITEDGIHLFLEDEGEEWRGLGSTAPQKRFVTAENSRLELELADVSVEAMSHFLGGEADGSPAGITTTAAGAGVAGSKRVNLLRGFDRNEVALLARKADSPYGTAFNAQYWIPRAVQAGSAEVVSVKGEPQVLAFSFIFLEDPTNGFGVYEAQTAAPSS